MAETGALQYELRPCAAAPTDLGLEPAGQGLLYQGPQGPAYADADGGQLRVRGPGPVRLEFALPLLAAHHAISGKSDVALTADGQPLVMRRAGRSKGRRGRAIVVLDGDREIAVFRMGKRSIVSMERPDGAMISQLPKLPGGTGQLAGDVQALEISLLLAFAASMFAKALESRWWKLF